MDVRGSNQLEGCNYRYGLLVRGRGLLERYNSWLGVAHRV